MVSYNKNGTFPHKHFKSLLNEFFIFRVEGRCGFIQKQNRSVLKKSTSNGNPLALPSRKGKPPICNFSLIPLRQLSNKAISSSLLGSSNNLFIRRPRISITN